MVGEESELRIQATHSLINSSPQKLLAWHFLNFTRPHHVDRAAQYQLGIKAPTSVVCHLWRAIAPINRKISMNNVSSNGRSPSAGSSNTISGHGPRPPLDRLR